MVAIFEALISAALALVGIASVYEYTLYTSEQRERAQRLAYAYLATGVLMVVVGVGGLAAAVLEPAVQWYLVAVIGIVAALSVIVQNRLNQQLGLENGPLITRLTEDWLGD